MASAANVAADDAAISKSVAARFILFYSPSNHFTQDAILPVVDLRPPMGKLQTGPTHVGSKADVAGLAGSTKSSRNSQGRIQFCNQAGSNTGRRQDAILHYNLSFSIKSVLPPTSVRRKSRPR